MILDVVGYAGIALGAVGLGIGAWMAHYRPRYAVAGERLALGCLGVFLAGAMFATCAPLASVVAGRVVERPRGKGDQFGIVVATEDGNVKIIGESGARERCREGQTVVKAAWTTAYSCDGVAIGSGSWAIFVAIGAEAVLAGLALAWAIWSPGWRDRRQA